MEPAGPLAGLFDDYLDQHHTIDRSSTTFPQFQTTFRLYAKSLTALATTAGSPVPIIEPIFLLAGSLRETPIRQPCGTTQQPPVGVFGDLKGLRSFIGWPTAEVILERVVKAPAPKLPRKWICPIRLGTLSP